MYGTSDAVETGLPNGLWSLPHLFLVLFVSSYNRPILLSRKDSKKGL